MKLSLYQRLSFALFTVFIIILLVFGWWSKHIEVQTRQESEQRLHLSLAANLARDNPLLQQGVYDYQALKNLFHTLMVLGPAFEFYYIDPQGNVLTHSVDNKLIKRHKIDLTPLKLLTENRASLPIYGDDPRHEARQKVFSAAPIFNGLNLQGYLYVIVAGERYQDAFETVETENKLEFSLVFILTSLIFLFLLMLWLFRSITQPLRQLRNQMLAFKNANFNQDVLALEKFNASDNEVAELAVVFSEMAIQINEQFHQLNQLDNKRKELLAEISHDLRTPLASIKGYIETIAIQGENLTPDKQQLYVETALKSASQLNKLIDQIFELAHLESGQVTINLENFNLTELLYDVAAKYSLKASQLEITLKVNNLANDIYIYSDIGKVERILSNLIDNALRHTAKQGEINLSVNDHSDHHCMLIVEDNGTGIKAQEIDYIFDARYRASNATVSKNNGLGLAITKKLIELLKSDIKVISELGKGTRFSFSLRKANK